MGNRVVPNGVTPNLGASPVSAAAFLRAWLGAVKALAEEVRHDGPDTAIVVLSPDTPLVAEWLQPRIAEAAIASAIPDGEAVALYALDRRTLALILRLDGAPVVGPTHQCADELDEGRAVLVALAEHQIAWTRRPGPAWSVQRGLA